MKFFMPYATTEREAERAYATLKANVQVTIPHWTFSNRRVFHLDYDHEATHYFAEVGREESQTRELCLAIFESATYLVCTPERGVTWSEPLRVERDDVRSVQYFEEND